MKKLVMSILAHVDSGKTTLSEAMLYESGNIKKMGRVDHGDTLLDSYSLEKDRGITIFSKQAVMDLGDTEITLLDTPGHIDFSTEMERTLKVPDYAILVISGTDGVQNHTETLWQLLRKNNIPTFIFVNKMDLNGAGRDFVMSNMKTKFKDSIVDFTNDSTDEFYEQVATCDEVLLDEYLENGKISVNSIIKAIKSRKIFPCFYGSALKLNGVKEFLQGIDKYTEMPPKKEEFTAKIFKIQRDEQENRLTYMKINGGVLKVKDLINGISRDEEQWSEKVNQIRIYSGSKYKAVDKVEQGTVCAVTGLTKTYAGQTLGVYENEESDFIEPVLSYKIIINDETDPHVLYLKLKILEEEETKLHVLWDERNQSISVEIMGELQLEIMKSIIKDRFKADVDFGEGNIVYKETISNIVEGVGHYEPLRHYSEVHLILEPLPRGSGLQFDSSCSEDILSKNWQRLVLTHLQEKTHIGVLTGSPITDMKITLAAGKAHPKHTEGGDFRQATYRAVRNGLMQAKSILLEPYYEFKLELPLDCVGRAMTDLERMNAIFQAPDFDEDKVIIEGSAPVAEIKSYPLEIASYTKGKGKLNCMLKGYDICHNQEEVVNEFNYNPEADLDNSPDSIFCSHGVGVLVKWDEVPNTMHIESVLNPKKQEEMKVVEERKQVYERYRCALEEDKELLEIFERTYGAVKSDKYYALKTPKRPDSTVKPKNVKPVEKKDKYLLVDGYNVIFAWDELSKMAENKNMDGARYKLMDRLCNYKALHDTNVILVFDAYRVKGNTGSVEKYHNIDVVYTKEKETADSYIERVTHEIGKKYDVRVVTSDNVESVIIYGNGAYRVTSENFLCEVESAEKEIMQFLTEK